MAASVPGIIEHVRVADIQQGNNPIRILNMRALPDSHVQDIKDEIHKENERTMDPNELAAAEQAGSFYNMEVSVAYHAKPSGEDVASKARNMGMQLVFYLGIKGLFGVPLPIWVELIGLVATARVRLQLTPDPPFLKTVTFTLMGIPKVQAGCTPMVEKGVNILNLPLISNFVNWAIGAAASMYVAPKSMTIDMSKMLQGDDIKKETLAIGVMFIRIHKATGLSKQDQRGSKGGGSDPYITVSWSKFGKPQFCTRVIQDDLNPVFEETCGLLVTSDLIIADEQLSMELWDSDRSSADDVVGKVELSIQKLIQHPGKMFPQVSKLRGVKADSSMPGELHWEVGFFGKTQFRKALRTQGQDIKLPKELADKPEFQEEKGAVESAEEDAVVHTPPDPLCLRASSASSFTRLSAWNWPTSRAPTESARARSTSRHGRRLAKSRRSKVASCPARTARFLSTTIWSTRREPRLSLRNPSSTPVLKSLSAIGGLALLRLPCATRATGSTIPSSGSCP